MKHFKEAKWRLFKERMCPKDMAEVMEDHLAACEPCRDIFLSLIGEEEIAQGAELLSPDFSRRVMAAVKNNGGQRVAGKKNRLGRREKNTPVYFAVAAAITLILMGGGLFQSLDRFISPFATGSMVFERPPAEPVIMGWPDKLVDRAANWMYNFETQGKGGL